MVDHTRQIQGFLEVLCVGVKYSLHAQGKDYSPQCQVPMHKAHLEVGGCGPPYYTFDPNLLGLLPGFWDFY